MTDANQELRPNDSWTGLRRQTRDALARVGEAVDALRKGRIVLVTDDNNREDEADLLMAAEHADADHINFMATHGRGLICQTITRDRADELDLPMQTGRNTALHGTAFTVSVDAAHGATSGISAADRAHTIRLLAGQAASPADLVRPGHVFPIVAHEAGVLGRRGHTEAGCDLARIAGLRPSAVICEVMAHDGTMARGDDVSELARKFKLPMLSVADVVLYRSLTADCAVQAEAEISLPTRFGSFTATMWSSEDPGCPEVIAVSSLDQFSGAHAAPLVRLHSECLTGESLGSLRCDCAAQLDAALRAISREPGVLLYLRQEGRGIGLTEKFRAYALQDRGRDTVDANLALGHRADERSYAAAAAVLLRLGIQQVRLLTNNPDKAEALLGCGIGVERIPVRDGHHPANQGYLQTKARRMGHDLEIA